MDQIWNQFSDSISNMIDKLEGWVNDLVVALPNIILAAVVLGASIVASRYLRKYFEKLISRFSNQQTVNRLVANMATAVFLLVMLFLVLGILNLDTALQSLLAGAGVVGLAVGLALQDPMVNLFSGIMMSTRNYFNLGDLIETNGFTGKIEKISLRSTIIKTFQGQEVILPNKTIYQNPLTNYTTPGERRVDLSCGVSYGDDLEKVERIAIQAIKDNVSFNEDRPVQLFYNSFGDSSINFSLRYWLDDCHQPDFLQAQSDGIKALKKAFDANDIVIPFPIRTLDFGVKGGERLDEIVPMDALTSSVGNGQQN